jgi:hypothetical protein
MGPISDRPSMAYITTGTTHPQSLKLGSHLLPQHSEGAAVGKKFVPPSITRQSGPFSYEWHQVPSFAFHSLRLKVCLHSWDSGSHYRPFVVFLFGGMLQWWRYRKFSKMNNVLCGKIIKEFPCKYSFHIWGDRLSCTERRSRCVLVRLGGSM